MLKQAHSHSARVRGQLWLVKWKGILQGWYLGEGGDPTGELPMHVGHFTRAQVARDAKQRGPHWGRPFALQVSEQVAGGQGGQPGSGAH